MKRFLIPETGQFYKANLHSHSTVSDGTLTPAQMKELYRSRGYSVLACTDHELMVPHHDLTDDGFVMLTGFELAGADKKFFPAEAEIRGDRIILRSQEVSEPGYARYAVREASKVVPRRRQRPSVEGRFIYVRRI